MSSQHKNQLEVTGLIQFRFLFTEMSLQLESSVKTGADYK